MTRENVYFKYNEVKLSTYNIGNRNLEIGGGSITILPVEFFDAYDAFIIDAEAHSLGLIDETLLVSYTFDTRNKKNT